MMHIVCAGKTEGNGRLCVINPFRGGMDADIHQDMKTIQELVRKLRAAGAKVNSSCGIHIHVDTSQHDVKTLRNLVNIMASKEDLLYKALDVEVAREHYCKKVDTKFLENLNAKKPKRTFRTWLLRLGLPMY